MTNELPVIAKTYDLLVWTLRHTGKFDRRHRYGLGMRLESHLGDVLDLLIEAKFSSQKYDVLRQAGYRLEQARVLLRACKDLHLIPLKSHQHAARQMTDISAQLGAWRRSAKRNDRETAR